MWMQIQNISFSKPCADLEEGVGGVFGLGQIKVEYLHSKITENMPRTLWQTQIFRRNPLPSLQKDSESKHDNSFKFFSVEQDFSIFISCNCTIFYMNFTLKLLIKVKNVI